MTQRSEQALERGANQASGQIYNDIINKAANDQCNTVFIQFDGRRVDLINVQCLQTLSHHKQMTQARWMKIEGKHSVRNTGRRGYVS